MRWGSTLILIVGLLILTEINYACTTPSYGMTVSSETTFCPGTYTLRGSNFVRDPAITITGNNFNVTCNNTTIIVTGGNGVISFDNAQNIILQNCKIYNKILRISGATVAVSSSNNVIIKNNYIDRGSQGISVASDSNSTIINNTINSTGAAIYLNSQNNIVMNNNILSTGSLDIKTNYCNNIIKENNGTNNYSIEYIDQDGTILENKRLAEIIICADNVVVNNITINSSPYSTNGIYIVEGDNILIENNKFEKTRTTIEAKNSNLVNVTTNLFYNITDVLSVLNSVEKIYFENNRIEEGGLHATIGLRSYATINYIINNTFEKYSGYFSLYSPATIKDNELYQAKGISVLSDCIIENNFLKDCDQGLQINRQNNRIVNNTVLNTGSDGLLIGLSGSSNEIIDNIICYSGSDDIKDNGNNNDYENNMCENSDPAGLCAEACRIIDVDVSITPPLPTTNDQLKCRAYPRALNNVSVEFRVYINGIYNETYDDNVSCSSGTYCYSEPFGPFEEGTVVSCEARAYDQVMNIYSDWTMSSSVEIIKPESGLNIKKNLPLITYYQCISPNEAMLYIFTEPEVELRIGSLYNLIIDNSGSFNTQLEVGSYNVVARKDGYYTQRRNVEISCTSCMNDYQCGDNQVCINMTCQQLQCGYCQYAEQHTCKNLECCKNADCEGYQVCNNNSCIDLSCEEGEIAKDHQCIAIEEQNQTNVENNNNNSYTSDGEETTAEINELQKDIEELKKDINAIEHKGVQIVRENIPDWLLILIGLAILLAVIDAFYLNKLRKLEHKLEEKEQELEEEFEDIEEELGLKDKKHKKKKD